MQDSKQAIIEPVLYLTRFIKNLSLQTLLLTFATQHSKLSTRNSTFDIRHSKPATRNSAFNIRHSKLETRHSKPATRNSAFDIRHSKLGIRHSAFNIRHSKLETRHLPLALLLLLTACAQPAPKPTESAEPWFNEIASQVGLDFQHVRATTDNYYFPEIMSGGIGWIDYDGDGWLDLYLVQGGDVVEETGHENKLYRNIDGSRFEDVTAAAGVGDTGYGMGLAVGDIDNDGDMDLYVTNVGPNKLYRNEGDGTFTDISEPAGVDHAGWGSSTAFADYDGDGWLDLYVVNYIRWAPHQEIECFSGGTGRDYCHPDNYRAPAVDVLFLNKGDGTFEDVSTQAGITVAGNGLGIMPGDYDNDGYLDFYVANDGDPNQLWMNNGDGTFTDKALLTGASVNRQGTAEAGMGVMSLDLENDGDLDLILAHLRDETNTVYRNDGGLFQDITLTTGLASPSLPYTGFGLSVADFNHDGYVDIYVGNGRVGRAGATTATDPFAEPDQLFTGSGQGKFEEASSFLPEIRQATTRGIAQADFDNDGDIDVAIINNHSAVSLLENVASKQGNWIGFISNEQQVRLKLTTSTSVRYEETRSAGSYQSAHDARILFTLPEGEQIMSVETRLPDGSTQQITALNPGTYNETKLK